MLKLEKGTQKNVFILRWREKEHFFDKQLLRALGIALSLHLGALALIQISALTFFSPFKFEPVQVQTSSPTLGSTIALSTSLPEEEWTFPQFFSPHMEWPTQELLPLSWSLSALDLQAFQGLEAHVWPLQQDPLPLALEEPAMRLFISGNLTDKILIKKDPQLSKMRLISFFEEEPVFVSYEVQVDERTGAIFWYEKKRSSGVSVMDELTKQILLSLRFAVDQSWENLTGTLDFSVWPSAFMPEGKKLPND